MNKEEINKLTHFTMLVFEVKKNILRNWRGLK